MLNQYYWPGFEATARLLHELCVALTDEFDVTVVTGMLPAEGVRPGREVVDGVEVIRVESTAFDRSRLLARGANYVTYLLQTLRTGLRLPRPDIVFCMTDPPMLGDIGLVIARRAHAPLVVTSQDVFPEIAVELGRLENPALVGLLRAMVHYYLRRADRVVAIGETMRSRLEAKGTPRERLTVIPNWVQTGTLSPQSRQSDWARERGLVDRFVVMHSGNVGHAQDLDSLIRAATFLRDVDDLAVVVVGSGARHANLMSLAERIEADRVQFLPYQDRAELPYSLSAADVHVVGLAAGLAGYVVPSRMYGVLSVGRPVIVAADAESETAQIVQRVKCGVVVPPGRPDLLAAVIREMHDGHHDLEAMGRRGREYVLAEADRDVAVARYRSLFRELAA